MVADLITVYREQRLDHEKFLDTVDRIGVDPFKKRVYEKEQ